MTRASALALCLLVASPAPVARAGELLEVRLTPHVMHAPGSLLVTVYVERDDAHRSLRIEADSSDYYRSSVIPLDGASAPRTHALRYANLPEGTYLIRVELVGVADTLAVVRQRAEVRGDMREGRPAS